MSVEVPIDQLFDEVGAWGFCYLLTVSDDERPHVIALRPVVADVDGTRVLRLHAGNGRAGRNAAARPAVTLVFPPADAGMSLVVDGRATSSTTHDGVVDVAPTSAVLHRAAP